MSMALLLSDLAPDVVFSIFACSDISSVVSAGQTCRYLHNLAFDKSVWLGLFDRLRRRFLVDRNCTPDLESLSTDEIIEVVRRLITGPQTWSPRELDCDPIAEVSTQITLHPTIRTAGATFSSITAVASNVGMLRTIDWSGGTRPP
ncbi:hypothetical protein B0H12DRAFT_1231925 [Mycena haematopus]|nr:hypothetical protein B0H12DRAFT_1231925 [Mycena haematopus]